MIRTFVALIAPALALLLLAAHFYRAQLLLPAIACVVLIAVLAVPRAWAARVVQVALVIGAAEWVRTLALLLAARMSMGQPHLRMTLILGGVALLTLASAAVFRSQALRARFRLR